MEELNDDNDNTLFLVDYEQEMAFTCGGDIFVDYGISFDDFLKCAEHIKKHRVNNGEKKVVDEG